MAERSFYLCARKIQGNFYALDKNYYLSKWCVETGKLLEKKYIDKIDFTNYKLDHDLYDHNWFNYSVITKLDDIQKGKMRVKVIQIDENGVFSEILSFLHPVTKDTEYHFYFNKDFNKMIELQLVSSGNKVDGFKGTYKEWSTLSVTKEKAWDFIKDLNTENSNYPEWHLKTLYPYPLNQDDLTAITYQLDDHHHHDHSKSEVNHEENEK
jgi:hypothetical protein